MAPMIKRSLIISLGQQLARATVCASLALALALLLVVVPRAHANLNVLITKGVSDPIPIAVVPFAHAPSDSGFDVADVVQHDLDGSGRFRLMPRASMRVQP